MSYPDEFLKGIPNHSFIGDDNGPTSDLFHFKPEHQRDDGFIEESICWRDNNNAEEILLKQKKSDAIQFKAGAAVMCRNELDRLMRKPLNKEILDYERREIPGNEYHGNLLLKKSVKKREMRKLAATIANACFLEIIPNPYKRIS